jgi:hypothetical protein
VNLLQAAIPSLAGLSADASASMTVADAEQILDLMSAAAGSDAARTVPGDYDDPERLFL